ncbi:MAG: zinc-binding dehydrogenase, partial [Gemmatimonadetes bacterium]|nr:zinc-binding dehydrogenase [Gemmatimonadota bacterium]
LRAAIFHTNGGPGVITVDEMPTPRPGPGEVRIRVAASSLNHLDLWMRRGLPIDIPMPHIGGSDIAGTVDELGPGVSPGWEGKRVVADPSLNYDWYRLARLANTRSAPLEIIGEHTQGGFAEYAVVPAANLMEIPEGVSDEVAAAGALVGVTAWHGLTSRGGLRAGERVLLTGASGGVSTMAIQYARAAGAEVFAITSSEDSVRRVRELGADHVFDRTACDWPREVYRATAKRGIDLCLDSVGEAIWRDLVRALAVGGRLVTFGATTGATGMTDIRLLFWRQLSLLGSTMGTPAEFRQAMNLIFDGVATPPIHSVLSLDEVREAHELLEAGGVFGKIVVRP